MVKVNKDIRTYFTPCSSVSVVNFEQVNAGWEVNRDFFSVLNTIMFSINTQ